jgi:hypothetical protein
MAEKGHASVTAVSSVLVPANYYRERLVIQLQGASPNNVALAFGEDAVYADGFRLTALTPIALVNGPMAREAVYGICTGAETATVGYQEDLAIA